MGEHKPENFFLMQPHFPKTRTHFLCRNIARNEESFGVLLFYYI